MAFVVFWFALLVAGTLYFILAPLDRARREARRDAARERLLKEKEAALLLLRDLEFDHRTGKLGTGDYEAARGEAEAQAVALLRRLDALAGSRPPVHEGGGPRPGTPREDRAPRSSAGVALWPLLLAGAVTAAGATGAGRDGSISGQAFTAPHPDSIAPGAAVVLVFREPGGDMVRRPGTTGSDGSFSFTDLPADTSVSYVLRFDYQDRGFLSAPIRFAPGDHDLEFSVLIDQPPVDQALAGLAADPALPDGHPSVPGFSLPSGTPVPQNPALTVLLTLAVALLFAAPVVALERKDRAGSPRRSESPGAAAVEMER